MYVFMYVYVYTYISAMYLVAFINVLILIVVGVFLYIANPLGTSGSAEKNENFGGITTTMDVPVMRWNYFMKLMVSDIKRIYPEAPEYKIKQKILGYNTIWLGMHDIPPHLVADVSVDISSNEWSIFTSDFLYNWKVSDDILNEIRECWAANAKSSLEVPISNLKRVRTPKISKKHMDRLRRMCTAPNPAQKIAILLQRYDYYGDMKEGLCLSAKSIYEFSKGKNVLEAFAGPLNSNLPKYCSLFSDLEKDFGSLGSFLMLPDEVVKEFDYVVLNPPYISSVMEKASEKIARCGCNSITIIPDWRSVQEVRESASSTTFLDTGIEKQQKLSEVPYPAFAHLFNSPGYVKTFATNSYMFENFFSDYQKKLPETNIIIVVTGTKLADQLEHYLLPE